MAESTTLRLSLSDRSHRPVWWDAGGGYSNTGRSTTVTDEWGRAKRPLEVRRRGHLASAEHALHTVDPGDHVVFAGWSRRAGWEVKVWRVDDIVLSAEAGLTAGEVTLSAQAAATLVASADSGSGLDSLPDWLRPVAGAVVGQARAYHARSPVWVDEARPITAADRRRTAEWAAAAKKLLDETRREADAARQAGWERDHVEVERQFAAAQAAWQEAARAVELLPGRAANVFFAQVPPVPSPGRAEWAEGGLADRYRHSAEQGRAEQEAAVALAAGAAAAEVELGALRDVFGDTIDAGVELRNGDRFSAGYPSQLYGVATVTPSVPAAQRPDGAAVDRWEADGGDVPPAPDEFVAWSFAADRPADVDSAQLRAQVAAMVADTDAWNEWCRRVGDAWADYQRWLAGVAAEGRTFTAWHRTGARTNLGDGWVLRPDGTARPPDSVSRRNSRVSDYHKTWHVAADEAAVSWSKSTTASDHVLDWFHRPDTLTQAQQAALHSIAVELDRRYSVGTGLASGVPSPHITEDWCGVPVAPAVEHGEEAADAGRAADEGPLFAAAAAAGADEPLAGDLVGEAAQALAARFTVRRPSRRNREGRERV